MAPAREESKAEIAGKVETHLCVGLSFIAIAAISWCLHQEADDVFRVVAVICTAIGFSYMVGCIACIYRLHSRS